MGQAAKPTSPTFATLNEVERAHILAALEADRRRGGGPEGGGENAEPPPEYAAPPNGQTGNQALHLPPVVVPSREAPCALPSMVASLGTGCSSPHRNSSCHIRISRRPSWFRQRHATCFSGESRSWDDARQRHDDKGDDSVLRISTAAEGGAQVTLTVEGDLVGAWVPLLEAECLHHLAARRSVEVDFAGVGFIDREGVAMLHGLCAKGVQILGASALVNTLLGRRDVP